MPYYCPLPSNITNLKPPSYPYSSHPSRVESRDRLEAEQPISLLDDLTECQTSGRACMCAWATSLCYNGATYPFERTHDTFHVPLRNHSNAQLLTLAQLGTPSFLGDPDRFPFPFPLPLPLPLSLSSRYSICIPSLPSIIYPSPYIT